MPINIYDIFYLQTVMEAYSIGVIGKILVSFFCITETSGFVGNVSHIKKAVNVQFLLLFANNKANHKNMLVCYLLTQNFQAGLVGRKNIVFAHCRRKRHFL